MTAIEIRLALNLRLTAGGFQGIRLEPPFTEDEFFQFCQDNRDLRIERTSDEKIQVRLPTLFPAANASPEITRQLGNWWHAHRRGIPFGCSVGFILPDSSMLSPTASYIGPDRKNLITKTGFSPVCPDFVIELRSASDDLAALKVKMVNWISNGAQLGWLIDPTDRTVHWYANDCYAHLDCSSAFELEGQGVVAGFALNLEEVWRCYE